MCNTLYYSCFPEYNEDTAFLINDIISNKHSVEYYLDVINKNKLNYYVLDAILSRDDISDLIIENVVYNALPQLKKDMCNSQKGVELFDSLIKKILHKKNSEMIVENMVKNYPSHIKDIMYFSLDNNTIPESTVKLLCNSFLKRKSLRKIPMQTPFVLLKDNDFAKSLLKNPKSDEAVFTAIAINKNLNNDIRNDAYDLGIDLSHAMTSHFFMTNYMVSEIYNCIVQTYTEMELNPESYKYRHKYDKEAVRLYEKSQMLLSSMVKEHLLPESLEIDLFNRIISLNQRTSNNVLQYLLMNTASDYIFDRIDLVRNKKDIYNAVTYGEYIPDYIKDNKIQECYNIIKNKKGKLCEYQEFFLNLVIKDRKIDNKIIYALNDTNKFNDALALSAYTPPDIIDDVIKKTKDHLRVGEILYVKYDEIFIYYALLNKVLCNSGIGVEARKYLLENFHTLPLSGVRYVKKNGTDEITFSCNPVSYYAFERLSENSKDIKKHMTDNEYKKFRASLMLISKEYEDDEMLKQCCLSLNKMFKDIDEFSTKNLDDDFFLFQSKIANDVNKFSKKVKDRRLEMFGCGKGIYRF